MDAAEAFWAARIASRFTDQMLGAVVEAARLSDPAAARVLTDVIIRRRDKVIAYWISRTNPLDGFAIDRKSGANELAFDNAALRLHAAEPGATYRTEWLALDNLSGRERSIGPEFDHAEPRMAIPDAAWGPADDSGFRYAIASIRTIHSGFPNWISPVRVTVRDRRGDLQIVGVERPTIDEVIHQGNTNARR